MATLDDAVRQMLAAGMPDFPSGHPRANTPRIVRYGPKQKAWYRLHEYRAKNGDYYVSGAYGLWGLIESAKIETDWTGIDQAERDRIVKQQAAAEEREREKRAERAKFAARRAAAQWYAANQLGGSDYLKRKQINAEKGVRFQADGTVLVPMLRYDGDKPHLVGLQKIAPDGTKRFNKSMAKEGAACRMGAVREGEPILIAEGLATALTIRIATAKRFPVFIAFDCYNVAPVAKILRAKYAEHKLVFCADDDYATTGNPGVTKAQAAAAAVGNAIVLKPAFKDRGDKAWTDFNDLHCAEGLEAVTKQLADVSTTPPKEAKRKPPPARALDWGDFFKRFGLIYPTETAWDEQIEEIVRVAVMRTHFGKGAVDYWLQSPDRRTVLASDVVFDPSGRIGAHQINLHRGMAFKPVDGDCSKLLALLHWLCGEDDRVFDWVLKWASYPLQHLGAKMATSVVMHGHEGTGKNLFWGAISKIYGKYGGIITQFQLESRFNDWISRKQFVVANEVVTRMELKHMVGYLKNLITEPRIPIETKNMPGREEDNHMQLVFLSNELRPLHISPGDRRHMLIKTPEAQDKQYYAAVKCEIDAGGVEALFYHLLHNVELGDFNEHTKPIMTAAKHDVIEMGLSSTQLFWQEMHEGLVPLPYGPCLSQDLYRGYARWCTINGEKNAARQNQFSHEFMSMNGVTRHPKHIADPDRPFERALPSDKQPKRMVFVMGNRPEDQEERRWLLNGVDDFRGALKDYIYGRGGAPLPDESKDAHT